MDSIISNQLRSLSCDAFALSLLRDNVEVHLENGVVSGRFLAIHSLANAPWYGRQVSVNAERLHQELQAAWSGLAEIPIDRLATSSRTLSLRESSPSSGSHRAPGVVGDARRLGALFSELVTELTRLALEAPARSRLSVRVPESVGKQLGELKP